MSANNILLIGSDDSALIDSGYCTHSEQTVSLVSAALGARALDTLLNTHLHSDHCGGNAALQLRFPELRTHIPPGEAAAVRRWDEDALSYRATGQQCPRFEFQNVLEPGSEKYLGDLLWQVFAAPGHDPHSVILFNPESRTLISADALWEKGFGVVFPELVGEPSFGDVAATFDLIESLAPQTVIPGHGSAFHDVRRALAGARERLDRQAANPSKHARHALKVLIKFKLLETQSILTEDLCEWARNTPYFELVRARFFVDESLSAITRELLDELVHSGAAAISGTSIVDR
ncbi:MBL fold metallo-hydrolase [Variovorax sp. J22G21]|uniref:MBL fold metallo-hydrolase n=1 Tax=Variovorax fucosicus TaxID=3053517 RepID=UPI0025749199|nr:MULTISPECIES: MBL fold metallo-hydrolase [unclassified Variovorax]MDM0042431.1 MBL fold metallo-hydrolase [Variovorax sp. J22R193]MDM0061036.1 MBL fold metallo-hydrolase [Variovorax sp. J22G21]